MKQFILALIFIGIQTQVIGQSSNSFPVETVQFHSDRNLYVSGEMIWFSANCPSNDQLSTVLYVELHDHEGKAFVRKKYPIQNHHAEGALTIPDKLPSGTYYLRAYTQYQRNLSAEAFTYASVTIIQPEKQLPRVTASAKQPAPQENTRSSITSTTDKPEYGSREQVRLRIFNDYPEDQLPLNLSITVVKKGAILKEQPDLDRYFSASKRVKEIDFIPEIRDVSISGKIVNTETKKGEQGVTCWVSIMNDPESIHTMRTDSLGRFLFSLNELYGSHQLFLGMDHPNKGNLEWQINQDFSAEFPKLPQIPLQIDSADQRLIEELFVSKQVNEQFPQQTGTSKKGTTSLPFNIGKPNIVRDLNNYVEIPKLEEVFNEFVPAVSVRRKKGYPYFVIWDEEGQLNYDNPLVLVDNVPIFDVAAVMNLSPGDVQSIGVIDRPYTLGAHTFGGVILLTTDTDNLGGIKLSKSSVFLSFEGLSESQQFHEKEISDKKNLPDFRNTLYWNPSVNLTSSPHTITFFTSDQTGSYEVWVKGITKEGKIVQSNSQFEIVRKSKTSK